MRVTQRTADNLVIEEGAGTRVIVGVAFVVIGAFVLLLGWIKGPTLFVFIGPLFSLIGLYYLLFGKTKTHRFERWRGMLVIESKGLLGSERRELPLASIADIVVEEERRARSGPVHRVYYVTTQGERILWADSYDGSKENTLDCFRAGREFLGLPPAPGIGDEAPSQARQPERNVT